QRVDVLIFFGRILGVFDRTVRPMTEPFRMLAHPGMVRRTLDREVESDLQSKAIRRGDEMIEIVERSERRLNRVVATRLAADRPWTTRAVGQRRERVVRPLAMRVADRMNWRQVHHVEAEIADMRQPMLSLAQGGRLSWDRALRARKDLVPGARARQRPIGGNLEQRLELRRAESRAI